MSDDLYCDGMLLAVVDALDRGARLLFAITPVRRSYLCSLSQERLGPQPFSTAIIFPDWPTDTQDRT